MWRAPAWPLQIRAACLPRRPTSAGEALWKWRAKDSLETNPSPPCMRQVWGRVLKAGVVEAEVRVHADVEHAAEVRLLQQHDGACLRSLRPGARRNGDRHLN